jgi:hypothetical protein
MHMTANDLINVLVDGIRLTIGFLHMSAHPSQRRGYRNHA